MISSIPAWLQQPAVDPGDAPELHSSPGVLFVGRDNVGRSAFAEAALRHALGPHSPVRVTSAGTRALVGHPMDDAMAVEARRAGIDATGHRARQLTGDLVDQAIVVFTFSPEHGERITLNHPQDAAKVIALGQAATALRDLPPNATVPLSALPEVGRQRCSSFSEGAWIPDPSGQGPLAAEATAERIQVCLDLLRRHIVWTE